MSRLAAWGAKAPPRRHTSGAIGGATGLQTRGFQSGGAGFVPAAYVPGHSNAGDDITVAWPKADPGPGSAK